jgi:hypothetical protein
VETQGMMLEADCVASNTNGTWSAAECTGVVGIRYVSV